MQTKLTRQGRCTNLHIFFVTKTFSRIFRINPLVILYALYSIILNQIYNTYKSRSCLSIFYRAHCNRNILAIACQLRKLFTSLAQHRPCPSRIVSNASVNHHSTKNVRRFGCPFTPLLNLQFPFLRINQLNIQDLL